MPNKKKANAAILIGGKINPGNRALKGIKTNFT